MPDTRTRLYEEIVSKFDWIKSETRRLNQNYQLTDEEVEEGMSIEDVLLQSEDMLDETLYNVECLLNAFDDDILGSFAVSFDAEFTQDGDNFWRSFDPYVILTPSDYPQLYIGIACGGYYINGGGGAPCDPIELNEEPARDTVRQYKEKIKSFGYADNLLRKHSMEQEICKQLQEMIARCKWTFAKTMPSTPHEYIVRSKCPLTDEEFVYFVEMQRQYGEMEQWGKDNYFYLYIDDYKYWTMGAPVNKTTVINRAKVSTLKGVQRMYEAIENIKKEVEENRPYHFNALLNASPLEPNVSSIFAGFLRQRINGRHLVLESFIKFCFGESFTSNIEHPIIETEIGVKGLKRIDILIYEKNKYAIVIENKIWDATEQPNQLANYIEGVKEPEFGFTDHQIYVVYMPSTDEHGPTTVSWSKYYQQVFENRYRNISFRDSVVKWLESDDIQAIDETYFAHSRFLFIDFLKRVFNLTDTDQMENKKIDEYIRKELELRDNDISYNIAKLTAKCNEITECANQLERIRKDYCCAILKEWNSRLEIDFPQYKKHEICFGKKMCTGIVLPYKDIEDGIYINLEFIDKRLCCGATYMPTTHNIREEMQASDIIRPFWDSKEFVKGVDWLFYKYINVEEGYECLHELIQRIIRIR